jgi:gluconolactonase
VAFETVATGYGLAEAPCLDASGRLCFSDVFGGVYRLDNGGSVETLIADRRGVGGMALHEDGGLVVGGPEVIHVRDGVRRVVLAAPEGVVGFNDMAALPDGSLLVGALRYSPFGRDPPVPGEIWRVQQGGAAEVFTDGVLLANGIGHSPDFGTIYICDYARGEVLAAAPDGGERRLFARSPTGAADGLAVDAQGDVWVALGAGGAVGRFAPDGRLRATVETGAEFLASVCFDGTTLFATTGSRTGGGGVLRATVDASGLVLTPARV